MPRSRQSVDTVRDYLTNIGRYRLLKAHEEVELAKTIQEYLRIQKPTQQQKFAYERARRIMYTHNLRLVVSIAKKYSKGDTDLLLDFTQEGGISLSRAIEKFDPSKGYKFSTYATWWIRQAITRHIGNHSRVIRLPIHLHERERLIKKTFKQLMVEHGRRPTLEEVAAVAEMTVEKIEFTLKSCSHTYSLDLKIGEDKEDTLLNMVACDSYDSPDEAFDSNLLIKQVRGILSELENRDRLLISLRFGIDCDHCHTLKEIGDTLNLSRERVRQIEAKILRKLKAKYRSSYYEDLRSFVK